MFYDCSATDWTAFGVSKLKRRLHTGLSESTLVKVPHCWKSHIKVQIYVSIIQKKPFQMLIGVKEGRRGGGGGQGDRTPPEFHKNKGF